MIPVLDDPPCDSVHLRQAAELDRGAVMCNLVKAENLPSRSGPVSASLDQGEPAVGTGGMFSNILEIGDFGWMSLMFHAVRFGKNQSNGD